LLASLIALVACQPQIALVEVTRLVEVSPDPAAPPGTTVEVTRVVAQEVTRIVPQEVAVEITRSPLGSAERPVQLLFAPTVDTAIIAGRGQALAQALAAATGREYAVGVLDSEERVVELMCTAPADTIGFLSAVGYVLAHEQCGVQVASVAVHDDGLTWQAGMVVVRRDSGIDSVEDLAGKRWAVPDRASLSNFLAFQALFAEAGVGIGEIVETPGDSNAVLAVYNGDVDFATATYVPPILPYDERPWHFGQDSPEMWRDLDVAPRRSPIGYVLVNGEPEAGGYRLRDARAAVFDATPDIYSETAILTLSAPIPNESVGLGADFPLGLAREVIAALANFAGSEACQSSLCSADFYGWAGLAPAEDASYDSLRSLIETLRLSDEDDA
jgi:phosphonate transport system substrate-binding protein